MHRLWDSVVRPALALLGPRVVVEIGAGEGTNTRHLIEFCRQHQAILHTIDPQPGFPAPAWEEQYRDCWVFHGTISLAALPTIGAADAVLIDGDHNWYTVFNELKLIEGRSRDLARPFPLVLLHDIGWPYGRRDLYYDPATIPEAFRKPCARKGMRPGVSRLADSGGFNAHISNALEETGPRNGVLTAIEDFLREARSPIELVRVPAFHGLGILVAEDRKAGRPELARWLAGLAPSPAAAPYLAALEAQRVDLEIREAERAAAEGDARAGRRGDAVAAAVSLIVAGDRGAEETIALRERIHAQEAKLAALEQQASQNSALLAESRRDLRAVRAERNRHRRDLEDLARLAEHLEVAVGQLLRTRRWQVANALGNLGGRLLMRPPTNPAGHARKLIDRLRGWRLGHARPPAGGAGRAALPVGLDRDERAPAPMLVDAALQGLDGAESSLAERSEALRALREELGRLAEHLQRQHDAIGAVQPPLAASAARTGEGIEDLLLQFCDEFLHEEHAIRLTLADVRSALAAVAPPSPAPSPPAAAPTAVTLGPSPGSRGPRPRTKLSIAVCVWDAASNPLGRAYLIADMLQRAFAVQVLGACFPAYGSEVWAPLRHPRLPIRTWVGRQFPHHFREMRHAIGDVKSDAVLVSKPRLPSYELGMLISSAMQRPVLLDVDDYELAFFPDREALSLDEVARRRHDPDFLRPYGNLWTRYCEGIVGAANAVTVSNAVLQARYGGTVLPHARDEQLFDPARYDRQAVRARFGYGPSDFVILFVGTPRRHKGLPEIAAALECLGDPRYRLCVIGSITDPVIQRRLAPAHVDVHPEQPFDALPATLSMADLLCLLQDPASEISHYQMPAKFTDGLAMAIPMLANDVLPLRPLAARGLVELVGTMALEDKLRDIYAHRDDFRQRASVNRQVFLDEYSYAAHAPRLCRAVAELASSGARPAREYQDLLDFHRACFGDGTGDVAHA